MAENIVFVRGDYWDVHDNGMVYCGSHGTYGSYGERRAEIAGPQPSWQPYQVELTAEQQRVRHAVEVMREEGVLRYGYDLAWVYQVMKEQDDCPSFKHTVSFLKYLDFIGLTDLPSTDSLRKKVDTMKGRHPNWKFLDTEDDNEVRRRNHVASRFLHCFRTGR